MKTNTKNNLLAIAISASLISLFAQPSIAAPGFGGPPQQGGGPQENQGGAQQGAPDATSILTRMDYDEDGIVTLDDFFNHSLERTAKHFERMDSDEDGIVTEEEFMFRKSGRQQNDSIDHDALKLCIENTTGISLNDRPTPEEAFIAADADGDGVLSSDEFLNDKASHVEDRFADLDSNADGVISAEEVEADLTERDSVRSAHQSCISEQLLIDEPSNNI